jgi:hypothetical protein
MTSQECKFLKITYFLRITGKPVITENFFNIAHSVMIHMRKRFVDTLSSYLETDTP